MRIRRLVEVPVMLLALTTGQLVGLRMWAPAIALTMVVMVAVAALDRRTFEED